MEKGRLHFFDNPAFLNYVAGLPEQSQRVLLVPGEKPGDDRYLISVRQGDNRPDVSCESCTENIE
jgi:hypothetical protein